ncbi:hypothetical protein [Thalassospira mesophila]|uniref:Lipoprotein n=1 Tax=Thalassospira mesophila TaxID=1293891 RepID=A0A1Y2KYC8_9PROT|nr:hypothetical protein [Thalassospira mesophila]OSQ37452.1 hypothetical protein TMES_14725 [Thalassospira mesophila]
MITTTRLSRVCLALAGISPFVLTGCQTLPTGDVATSPDRLPPTLVMPSRPAMADDWSDGLPVIYNQVAGCLNADPTPPARVVDAGQNGDGQIVIDMMGDSGSYMRCVSDPSGKSKPVLFDQAVPDNVPGPVYTATPYPPPKSPNATICYEHLPVLDKTGWQLGWLSYALKQGQCSDRTVAHP